MSRLADDLQALRDLLEEPGAWVQGHYAVNRDGYEVHHGRTDAVGWCLSGACREVAGMHFWEREVQLRAAILAVTGQDMIGWNDATGRTHAEVLAAIDRAIASAEKEG